MSEKFTLLLLMDLYSSMLNHKKASKAKDLKTRFYHLGAYETISHIITFIQKYRRYEICKQ